MTRILSSIVLIPVVVGGIWFAPHWGLVVLVEAVLVAAFVEYAGLVERTGTPIPRVVAGASAAVVCAGQFEAAGRRRGGAIDGKEVEQRRERRFGGVADEDPVEPRGDVEHPAAVSR